MEHYCKRLARLAGTMGFLARSTLGVVGAPNALAEVETVHYYPSLPRSIGKSLWHFQPIDPWKYRLVAALAATPVVFLDPYVACPIFAKKVPITLFRTAVVCIGNEEIPTSVGTANARRKVIYNYARASLLALLYSVISPAFIIHKFI